MEAVYWLLPDLLAGRPGPRRKPWDLEGLWAGGIRAIVSLAPQVDEAAIAAAGFEHGRFYFRSTMLLRRHDRDGFLAVMDRAVDFLHAHVVAGRPALVHCHAGKDRTGAVLAGYLIRYRGLSAQEAFRRMRQVNPRAMTALGYARMPALFEQAL